MLDIYKYMGHYRARHPEQRAGQAYFNALHERHPDVANEIRATEFDPFHDDAIIPAFFRRLQDFQIS